MTPDELDERVKSIDWTSDACRFGSPQRRDVAQLALASGLIEQRVRPLFPSRKARERMVEYVRDRLVEKITGVGFVSNPNSWNPHNLWDPLYGGSFAGWLRQTAFVLARGNARHVLVDAQCREHTESETVQDDGANPLWDDRRHHGLYDNEGDLLSLVPGLRVPRPVGVLRTHLTGLWRDGSDAGVRLVVADCRRSGWWHESLDELDANAAVFLLLAPLSLGQQRRLAGLDADHGVLLREYAASQSKRGKCDERLLARLVHELTVGAGYVDEFESWCVLGSLAASILVG